jgi:hypothetical protein
MSRNAFTPVYVGGIELKPRPALMVSFQLPKSVRAARLRTVKERVEYWSQFGRGIMPMHSLVCLVDQRQGRPIAFATVVRREVKELAATNTWPHPIIGINIIGSLDEEAEILKFLQGLPISVLERDEERSGSSSSSKPERPEAAPQRFFREMPHVALVQVRNLAHAFSNNVTEGLSSELV